MLQVMNCFSDYQNNITKIKSLLSQDIEGFSMSQFDSNGNLVLTNEQKQKVDLGKVKIAEDLYKENIKLKNKMQALSESKIILFYYSYSFLRITQHLIFFHISLFMHKN